jgi:hypothetical protein
MSETAEAKAEWVHRVLGVSVGGQGRTQVDRTRTISTIRDTWLKANDEVDRQLETLRTRLRKSANSGMREIAETGLNAVTGGLKVKLLVALQMMDAAGEAGFAAAAPRLIKAAAALRDQLLSDPRVAACDACPHETVTIRATLGTALADIVRTLREATKRGATP